MPRRDYVPRPTRHIGIRQAAMFALLFNIGMVDAAIVSILLTIPNAGAL